MRRIPDWNGNEVELAESKGGVLAFVNPLEGLIRSGVTPWPAPEIVQKLYESRQVRAFDGDDKRAVTRVLGFYTDVQSMHSEDAITWSVFGPISYAPPKRRIEFVTELFHKVSPSLPEPRSAVISLWRRLPHPDTRVSGGPEIDFLIQTEEVVLLGEAKWLSGVGTGQGKGKNKDQITLRKEFLLKYGWKFFRSVTHYVVLSVSLREAVLDHVVQPSGDVELLMRALTWSEICSLTSHTSAQELREYYEWKRKNSKMRRGRLTS